MPNRIIKESHCLSEKIASLTDFEFRLWVGLITQVDDAGRGDARPAIIKGRVFPFRDRVTVKDIDASLHALAAKGCISLYCVGGKSYFWFPSWAEHQRVRDYKPKYPGPEDADESLTVGGERRPMAADGGLNPNPNPNPNPNQNTNTGDNAPARKRYGEYANVLLSDKDVEKLKAEFPGDWEQRIDRLSGYIASTGKTYKNHLATIREWAKRDAKKGGPQSGKNPSSPAQTQRYGLYL